MNSAVGPFLNTMERENELVGHLPICSFSFPKKSDGVGTLRVVSVKATKNSVIQELRSADVLNTETDLEPSRVCEIGITEITVQTEQS